MSINTDTFTTTEITSNMCDCDVKMQKGIDNEKVFFDASKGWYSKDALHALIKALEKLSGD